MSRKEIDKIATEIYRLTTFGEDTIFPFTVEDFQKEGKDCKAFYRKLARWHLRKIWALKDNLKKEAP